MIDTGTEFLPACLLAIQHVKAQKANP